MRNAVHELVREGCATRCTHDAAQHGANENGYGYGYRYAAQHGAGMGMGFFLDPEHVKCPILLRTSANQLDKSTSNPSPVSGKAITDQDHRESMPSYTRVGEFLFEVLAKELQASRDSPAFDRYSTAGEIIEAFKLRFEAYTRQYPPFSLVAIKIFSILGNSMPEERTVSRFTRTDTRDRANQDARTIVDQTKIYQHLRREGRAADKLPKPSKAPSFKWRSVKHLMTVAKPPEPVIDLTVDNEAAPNSAANVLGPSITPECQAGLEALNAGTEADDLASGTSTDTTLTVFRDGIDIYTIRNLAECMTRTTALALLASTLLLAVTAQTQPVPTLCDFECLEGQYIVGRTANWALTGSSYNVAVTFMSDFCGASIGNTAVNCTGAALGSTRRVLQANGVYITEQLQNLTLTHPKGTHDKGTHPKGTLSQVVISTDPDAYDEGTWTYYDYAHLSDIQVYHNHSTGALSMSMTTHKCVSNATMGDAAVVGLLAKAQAYYISAIANATAAQ
ncbi:hypothetical protein DFH09DRAFT_1357828 [Mycena vulgaris]|nr:hypothetical protein DFH09DRAFT_1357828 [Mycena vulgaris]